MISTGIELGESSASRQSLATLPGRSGRKSIHGILKFVTAGFSHDEFLGKKPWDIGLFCDTQECLAAFRKLQETEYIRYENLPPATRDGRCIEAEFVSNVYSVPGGKVIQCNVRDITARAFCQQGDGRRRF